MTLEELRRIAASVEERRGWDFSRVRDGREAVPWDYVEVVRNYLRPSDRVLDVGTGGGERFLSLASRFGVGVGVDASAEMIETALANKSASAVENVSFEVMRAEALRFAGGEFDVVLNRHCVVDVGESYRVLRPGGYFITQQVGARNTQNICTLFGCGPGGEYERDWGQEMQTLAQAFRRLGGRVVCRAEYDVRYWFLDVASLLFWHKAIPMPEDFYIDVHWRQVDQIITEFGTPNGIETNEHRELLIVQKQVTGAEG
jgi:ubiquinone/menaquinone biosynthesis C-methylase UbiE